VKKAGF